MGLEPGCDTLVIVLPCKLHTLLHLKNYCEWNRAARRMERSRRCSRGTFCWEIPPEAVAALDPAAVRGPFAPGGSSPPLVGVQSHRGREGGQTMKGACCEVPCMSVLVRLSLVPHPLHRWLRPLPRDCGARWVPFHQCYLCVWLFPKGLITFLKKIIILGLQQKIQGLSLEGGCCGRVQGLRGHPAIAASPTTWPFFHTSPPLFILLHVFQNCPRLYTPRREINFQRNTHREIHVQNMFFCCQKKNNKWLGRRENTFPD